MPSKGAGELNQSKKDEQIIENLQRQANGIKTIIEQRVVSNIPKNRDEEIEILDIEFRDYTPLGKIDYKGNNFIVRYARITHDEEGNENIAQEHMIFSADELGEITGVLASIDSDGKIELSDEFEDKVRQSKNGKLVENKDGGNYLSKKDGKLQAIDEEERKRQINEEEVEKKEIAQSYRKLYGGKEGQKQGKDAIKDDILSITEIEDPSVFARVLEVPLNNVKGKYKIVRFKNDKFILVDDKNTIMAGLEISELAKDIHDELNIRPQDPNTRIKAREIDTASTTPGRYNILKINNPNIDSPEVMIAFGPNANSDVHVFERNAQGDLEPVDTCRKHPPKIIENGEENTILPRWCK